MRKNRRPARGDLHLGWAKEEDFFPSAHVCACNRSSSSSSVGEAATTCGVAELHWASF